MFLHPGKGVRTPPVARKPRQVITVEQFDRLIAAIDDEAMQLLAETDVESGLRWGELTELRVRDLDQTSGVLTVARAVVELTGRDRPDGKRFLVKDYPKDQEWRRLRLAPHLVAKLVDHIERYRLGPDDLLFTQPQPTEPRRRPRVADDVAAPVVRLTEPNAEGRRYRHGTLSAYQAGSCRCDRCRDAVAAYRAARRAAGKDSPRTLKTVDTDGHLSNSWFRHHIWDKAVKQAEIGVHVTPHGLRHAHASWLLAGGADLQVVRERLGHASIATTEKYLHTLPGADQAALDALDAIRGKRTG